MSSSEIDKIGNVERKQGRQQWLGAALAVLLVVPFLAVGIVLFISRGIPVLESSISQISENLSVPVNVLVASFLVSFLLVILLLALRSTSGRESFLLALTTILGSERSFYAIRNSLMRNETGDYLSERDQREQKLRKRLDGLEKLFGQTAKDPTNGSFNQEVRDAAIMAIVSAVSDEVRAGIKEKLSYQRLDELERAALSRMSDQVVTLGRRANISLWTGVLFCLSGLGILWTTLVYPAQIDPSFPVTNRAWADFLVLYAPRLSIVLIVEIIGFFFLRLFRTALDEVRLIQNEITNVEAKFTALHLAVSKAEKELPKVISALLATERNMLINRGQTTVELEKARASRLVDAKFLDSLAALFRQK